MKERLIWALCSKNFPESKETAPKGRFSFFVIVVVKKWVFLLLFLKSGQEKAICVGFGRCPLLMMNQPKIRMVF